MTSEPLGATMSAAEAASGDDLTGKVFSERYRLIERVGEGGMGAVYRAEHVRMHNTVAVKVLHPELTTIAEVVQRFEREAQAAANIDHPNVCAARDFSRAETGHYYLVMEFLEGRTLDDVIAEVGALPSARAVRIASQICAALSRAHEMGIVHRDLKPENVGLVEREGEPETVKVLDFGIARVTLPAGEGAAPTLTRAGFVMGTPAYISPEQATGADVDHRADLYALGVVLFEMLAGRRPFESPSTVELIGMHVTKPAPPVTLTAPADAHIPRRLEQLVARLLAKEAAQRPESAKAVRDELEEIARDLAEKHPSDAVAAFARNIAARAVSGLGTVGERVVPVLQEAREAAPGAVPLLRRAPRWIWAAVATNMLVGTAVSAMVCSSLCTPAGPDAPATSPPTAGPTPASTAGGAGEPAGSGAPAVTGEPVVAHVAGGAGDATDAAAPLAAVRARPEVAAILAKRDSHGAAAVARELEVLYRSQDSPELAYLLAQAESAAGDERAALAHVDAALGGAPAFAQDAEMRRWVVSKLGGRYGPAAGQVVAHHYLPGHAAELESLSCSAERQPGRRRAQTLVLEAGALDRVPRWCKLVIELETASSCAQRQLVVKQMATDGDARVLPALRGVEVKRSRGGFFRRRRGGGVNACLAEDLERTIATVGGGAFAADAGAPPPSAP